MLLRYRKKLKLFHEKAAPMQTELSRENPTLSPQPIFVCACPFAGLQALATRQAASTAKAIDRNFIFRSCREMCHLLVRQVC